jgi:sigma-E factor negative regulatory protein RseC
MLEEHGYVVEVNDKLAVIQTKRTGICEQCTNHKGCGTASLASVLGQKTICITVVNDKEAKVGDNVVIGLEEQTLLKSALIFYLPPLLGLFVGAMGYDILATKTQLPNSEILTVFAGLVGFWMGFGWVKRVTVKMSKDSHKGPVILKKL